MPEGVGRKTKGDDGRKAVDGWSKGQKDCTQGFPPALPCTQTKPKAELCPTSLENDPSVNEAWTSKSR